MGTREKLIKRFLSMPKDFTFKELSRLLGYFGYEKYAKGKTSGSRVIFRHPEREFPIMLHKPHPQPQLKIYALRQIPDELKQAGFINDELLNELK